MIGTNHDPADNYDPVLTRFRAALDKVYGKRVERVVSFGSRARGEARSDSDYDIAVFLRNPGSFWQEMGPLAKIEKTNILASVWRTPSR